MSGNARCPSDNGARTLGLMRAVVYALWLATFFRYWPGNVRLPAELFVPVGVFALLPAGWVSWLFEAINQHWLVWLLVPVFSAAALGLAPFRLWSALSLIGIVCLNGWILGQSGFIFHAQVMALLMAMVLTFSPAADGFAVLPRRPPRPEACRMALYVMLAASLLCYTFIGVHRVVHGDTAVFNGESLRSWLVVRSQDQTPLGFKLGLHVANTPALFMLYKIGFVFTTLVELLSLLCLYSRRFAIAWLAYMTVFHLLSLVTLNIFFWENTILLWFLMVPSLQLVIGRGPTPTRCTAPNDAPSSA